MESANAAKIPFLLFTK